MPKDFAYASKHARADGTYAYSVTETETWGHLFQRQMTYLDGRIAPQFLQGVKALGLTGDEVPQIKAVSARLGELTGAGVEGVPAIIPPSQFFRLLAERKFPVATFLRRPEDIDYIEEPDLFHEVFGHCPMLTDPFFCDFIERFGQIAMTLPKGTSWHLFRLFWFTVEFGMIDTPEGPRAYGAGIASSPSEARNACEGSPLLRPFDLIEVLRTPYRIDIVQPLYFVIPSFKELARVLDQDIAQAIDDAKELGDHTPLFEPA